MAAGNFEKCLAITLQWEGGYSNHPDDPGGPTMKGVIQREYDAWRRSKGLTVQPVKLIGTGELQAIYRTQYWDVMACDGLPAGYDLCVFDAAVNSGPGQAKAWAAGHKTVDTYQMARLSFLQHLGRLWRVFGRGWGRRVSGITAQAKAMAAVAPIMVNLNKPVLEKAAA